jgi:hypothetical protein
MSKFVAAYLNRPNLVTAIAISQWVIQVLEQWLLSGQVLTWQTLFSTAIAFYFARRPGDVTRPEVRAKLHEVRQSASAAGYEEGVRASVGGEWREEPTVNAKPFKAMP